MQEFISSDGHTLNINRISESFYNATLTTPYTTTRFQAKDIQLDVAPYLHLIDYVDNIIEEIQAQNEQSYDAKAVTNKCLKIKWY